MGENKEYKEMIDGFVEYQKNLHAKNQKKISVGLKVNILLPLVFLLLCFFSDGSKLIFLMLWIISLFGIAFYLVYVEFTDYKIVRKMKEFGMISDEEMENRKLIGDNIETAGDNLVERLDEIDEKIDANKKRIAETFQSGKERFGRKRKNSGRKRTLAGGKGEYDYKAQTANQSGRVREKRRGGRKS